MPVPQNRQLFGAQWNHSSSLEYRAEEKSSLLSSFWKEWLPRGKALHCHKRIVKPRAIYSSHNCLSASVFFFFFKKLSIMHNMPTLSLASASNPHHHPLRKLGSEKGLIQSHLSSQGTLESSPTWLQVRPLGTLSAAVTSAFAPLLLQTGEGISLAAGTGDLSVD